MTKRHTSTGDWPTLAVRNNNTAMIIVDGDSYIAEFYGTTNVSTAASSSGPLNNHWHFICGVRDNNSYKVYVDGALEKTATNNRTMIGDSSNMWIGYHDEWDMGFKGSIDEVRIYKRALSDNEINTIYLFSKEQ